MKPPWLRVPKEEEEPQQEPWLDPPSALCDGQGGARSNGQVWRRGRRRWHGDGREQGPSSTHGP